MYSLSARNQFRTFQPHNSDADLRGLRPFGGRGRHREEAELITGDESEEAALADLFAQVRAPSLQYPFVTRAEGLKVTKDLA